ncbi:MAG TPA: hypothetical protein VMS76_15215 [Planctomycetota bacterium]|nr:hypothetical protein [Planctomycetota bacterium]
MRSVLALTTKTLARSGLILAVLPVRAAAIPQAERPYRPGASEQGARNVSSVSQEGLSPLAVALEGR